MNESRIFALLAALMLALAGCSQGPEGAAGQPPLAGARIGGPFTLVDQDGKQVSDSDFNGRYRIIYFGYTYCPDVCPVDLQLVGRGLAMFEKEHPDLGAKVQPIFISVDPERDTPAVLKQYVANFHPRLIGLTGTPQQVDTVKKEFAIFSAKQAAEGSSEYLVDHTRMILLFGPDGKPIAILPEDKGPDGVAAELARWVR